jgi:tetratricopeptide (TPR) repeat protein
MVGLGLAAGIWIGVRAAAEWRFRRELRRAERAYAAQQYREAGAMLAQLARSWPRRGEVEYWLGNCELKAGHTAAALEAWGRVPDQAREAQRAAVARGRVAMNTGRYALAETCLLRAIRVGGDESEEARRLLSRVHWITGRRDEYRRYVERNAERMRDPSEELRTLWSLYYDPYPMSSMRTVLEEAHRTSPDDDRVWLALANLETRAGRFKQAGGWLERCERARPDDPAVWRSRLDWARAADRPDEVLRAASHLPARTFDQARVLELRAWLAGRGGDRQAERTELAALLALEPADSTAIERLADLAVQDGKKERVAELRRRKEEIEKQREEYRQLMNRPELAPLAAELAPMAEAIDRRFDAKAWWRLAIQRDPAVRAEAERALARLARTTVPPAAGTGSLADLLGTDRSPVTAPAAIAEGLSIPTYTEEAQRRGLVFTFNNGVSPKRQLPETMSGGVAVFDFDGDGWLDIYAIQGGPFPPPPGSPPFADRLFRNRGDGRFEDVTALSGLTALPGGYGHGAAVGDFDNDGRPDLFITRWRSYALYRNLGGGRFEDATVRAGLGGDRDWPTSAAWADLDNDGDLDLYVCHYLQWDAANPTLCGYPGEPEKGHSYCDPPAFPALPDHLFRNDGGRFTDVTAEAGIVDRNGRGLGVVAADLDDDGKIDVFVANDTSANYFFRNRGGLRFSEEATESGLAASAGGGYLAGMGVACGDFDGDGLVDLAVTNFLNQSTTLYHNHGGGIFSDRSTAAGLAALTRHKLGFGLAALDANNDGRLDLAQANGHVVDFRPTHQYAMPPQLFLGDGTGKLMDVSDRAGPPWQVLRLARGLATGDFDNDGRIDVVLVAENEPIALFCNRGTCTEGKLTATGGHFLTLALEGTTSNRDAVGARVRVTALGRTHVAERFGGGSYLCASDRRLHVGLGPALSIDRVEITWPSGRRDRHDGLAADTGYRIREGDAQPRTLEGFSCRQAAAKTGMKNEE